MNDFFSDNKGEKQPEEQQEQIPTKIKLGESEYSQEELDKLVNLGKTAQEYETKWNRPISEFYPDYTKKSQELAEIKRQQEQAEQENLNKKAKEGEELSVDEQRKLAREQAKNLGIITDDIFSQKVNEAVTNAMAGMEVINNTKEVVNSKKSNGLPDVELSRLISYMNGENSTGTRFGNPEMAYNDMFQKEIANTNRQKVEQIKPAPMQTNMQNSPQSQGPEPTRTNRDTLKNAITQGLLRRQQS